jgi:PTS system galactitol-specific IIA component
MGHKVAFSAIAAATRGGAVDRAAAMEATVRLGGEAMPLLVLRDLAVADAHGLFGTVAAELGGRGWVGPDFAEALRRRERQFPTGLDFGGFSVALPHADVEHVRRTGLVLVVTAEPVAFRAMDNPDRSLACRLVLLPLLTDPDRQVPFLAALTTALQRPGFYEDLIEAASPEALAARLQRAFD